MNLLESLFLAIIPGYKNTFYHIISRPIPSNLNNTALFDYINKVDTTYEYFEIPNSRITGAGFSAYILNMVIYLLNLNI